MTDRRPTTRAERRAKKPATLPKRFVPRFWEDADNRQLAIKRIRKRYEELVDHAGVDSVQKEILAQRAVYLEMKIATMELADIQGEPVDLGVLAQATNALKGLLKDLGLERVMRNGNAVDLEDYLEARA